MARPSRNALLIGAAGLVVLVALIVIALVRQPMELDPETPEGTVQGYLQAIADEDYDAAIAYLEPELAESCTASDLIEFAPQGPFSAVLVDSETTDDTATVVASISFTPAPGPLDPGLEGIDTYFDLTLIDGVWRITDDPWPFYTWSCT